MGCDVFDAQKNRAQCPQMCRLGLLPVTVEKRHKKAALVSAYGRKRTWPHGSAPASLNLVKHLTITNKADFFIDVVTKFTLET